MDRNTRAGCNGLHLVCGLIGILSVVGASGCGDQDDRHGERRPEEESCDPTLITHDLPLRYRIESDEKGPAAVKIETEGGEVVMYFTPWGVRAEPHTGHVGRDVKTNWRASLANSRADLVELSGDGDGACGQWETCGLPEETVLARRPRYVAPDDGMVVISVVLDRVHEPGFYYGTLNHWRIEATLCGNHYSFGHIGWVAEDLRAAMMAVGAPDPNLYSGPSSAELLPRPIELPRGATIAIPQIVGETNPSYPGMVIGDVWAQMEVPTYSRRAHRAEPIFSWIDPSVKDDLQAILWREMQDPASRIYGQGNLIHPWLWKAESSLYWADYANRDDYSSLLSDLGAWFENREDGGGCTEVDPLCDQAISVWPIVKAGPIFDASLYDSPSVSYLFMKSQRGGTYYRGEVVTPDVLGFSGTMLIKWRLEDYTRPMESYQKLSFALDPEARQLRLHWGQERSDRAAVEAEADPAIPTGLRCDGSSVLCMNHAWHDGVSMMPGY